MSPKSSTSSAPALPTRPVPEIQLYRRSPEVEYREMTNSDSLDMGYFKREVEVRNTSKVASRKTPTLNVFTSRKEELLY